jgi:hypothetical protein
MATIVSNGGGSLSVSSTMARMTLTTRTLTLGVILLGVTTCGSGNAQAQAFRIDEAPSISSVPVAQLRPKTIVFADKAGEPQDEGGGIFVRYEDWARTKPIEQQMLSLYPGYTEPNADLIVDGTKRHYREKLHMYVGEARFTVARAPASIDLGRYANLAFLQKIDPAIKQRLLMPTDPPRPKEPKTVHNQDPKRHWCEERANALCIRSEYKLEGRLPTGIALANKLREGSKKISDTLEFDSELAPVSAAEAEARGFRKLTGIDTPSIGALEQSIFYVNQVMQFGKLLAVFQQHPSDAAKTVVSVYMTLAVESNVLSKRREFASMPVLRNLVPVAVLGGKSSFNTGNSLSAGLPVYARNQTKAIAALLETP